MNDGFCGRKPLVAIRSVTKEYKLGETTVRALRGVDLEIHEGEFAAIWGPSGSGKTSLLNLIGLIDSPSSGRVVVAGRDTATVSDDALAEMRRGDDHFPIRAPGLNGLRNPLFGESLVARGIAFVHGEQTLVVRDQHLRGIVQCLDIHWVSPSVKPSDASWPRVDL